MCHISSAVITPCNVVEAADAEAAVDDGCGGGGCINGVEGADAEAAVDDAGLGDARFLVLIGRCFG